MRAFDTLTEYVNFPCHYNRLVWIYDAIESATVTNDATATILDVGCGTGNITIPLCSCKKSHVTGIDVHQGNLDYTSNKSKGITNLQLKFAYFEHFDISTYHHIVFTEVMEHIPNYIEILAHAANCGHPQMQLLITVPNGYGPFEIAMQPLYLLRKWKLNAFISKVKKLLGKKEPYSMNYDTPHVNFFTKKKFTAVCNQLGLKVIAVKKAYIIAPVIETYLPFIPLKKIARMDNWLAQKLPTFMCSGLYFKVVHNNAGNDRPLYNFKIKSKN